LSIIDYHGDKNILVSVKGHPYPRDAFFEVFESMAGIAYTAVEQPASQVFFRPDLARDYDAFVLYDMPGIDFSRQPPDLVAPPESFKADFLRLLDLGHGFVFLHHAIAAWPEWPEYAEIVGGRFLYLPGTVRNKPCLDSGYRHAVPYQARVLRGHPVTVGVDTSFPVTDELYLYEVFEDEVIPLLSSDYDFDRDHFFSARQAVMGNLYSNAGWDHPQGSSCIGWVKHYGNSPVVYLQMGDGVDAYENPHFRRLLSNAIHWVASDDGRRWARERNREGS
jgi:hypothetical protein